MRVPFVIALLTFSLLDSIRGYDRFIPGRLDKSPKEIQSTLSSYFRTLADDTDTYQSKVERSNATTDLVTTRLRGDTELGYYFVTLFFGTPLQRQTLIVDTGSVTTTIPCTECGSNCGPHHFNKPFDHKTSSSYEEFMCMDKFGDYVCNDCTNQCSFSVAYVEGSSYNGHFEKDFVAFGNEIEDLYDILLDPTIGPQRNLQDTNKSENSTVSLTQGTNSVNPDDNSADTKNSEDKQDSNNSSETGDSSREAEVNKSSDNTQNVENPSNSTATANETNKTDEKEPTDTVDATQTKTSEEPSNVETSENTVNSNSSGITAGDSGSNNTPATSAPDQANSTSTPEDNKEVANSSDTNGSQDSHTNTTDSQNFTNKEVDSSSKTIIAGNNTASMTQGQIDNTPGSTNTTNSDTKEDTKSSSEELTPEQKAKLQEKEFVQGIVKQRKTFVPFGCTVRETKLFYNQEADGILGLGINTDTNGSPPNLIDVLHRNSPNVKKAFSLCLGQLGGYLTTGGYNYAYHQNDEQIYHTDYYDNFGQYRVHLNKIEVNGKDVGLLPDVLNHGEGAFFDSGTTLTHVPSQTFSAIRSGLYDFCSEHQDSCGRKVIGEAFCFIYDPKRHATVDEFLKSFPTFTFYFGKDGSAKYEWKGEDYLTHKGEVGRYCMGLSHYERETILGGTFMKNHDVLFDKENKKIAFVRAECGAINFVTSPEYLYSTKADQKGKDSGNSPPTTINEGGPDDSEDYVDDNGTSSSLTSAWSQIQGFAIFILVGVLLGLVICGIVRFIKKRSYNTMHNEIEIPEARGAALSFESNIMPSPHDDLVKVNGGTSNTINSLVEASI